MLILTRGKTSGTQGHDPYTPSEEECIHGSANTILFTFLVLLRPWLYVWNQIDIFKDGKSSIYTQAKC